MRLATISKSAGAVSALVAVVALAASAINWQRDTKKQRIQEWQTVVVYSILDKASRTGLKIEEIKQLYLQAAQSLIDFDIPKEDIQELSLMRVLSTLHAAHVVERDANGLYALQTVSAFKYRPVYDDMFEQEQRMKITQFTVLAKVRSAPCQYTSDQLFFEIAPNTKISAEEFNLLIITLTASSMLRVENGRLCTSERPLHLSQTEIQPQQPSKLRGNESRPAVQRPPKNTTQNKLKRVKSSTGNKSTARRRR